MLASAVARIGAVSGSPLGLGAEAATGSSTETRLAVATTTALHLVNAEGSSLQPNRWTWDRLLSASWDAGRLHLRVQESPGGPVSTFTLMLDDPGEFPAVVWERVEASILATHRLSVAGASGVSAVARRRSGSDDVSWTVVFDDPGDATRDDLRELALGALSELRISLGI